MAAKTQRPKADPDAIYVALQSAAIGSLPGAPVVQKGTRLNGSNPFVQAAPWNFIPDGADDAERQERVRELYGEGSNEPHEQPDYTPPPSPLRDEDAVVAIRPISSGAVLV